MKVLMVLTSTRKLGDSDYETGLDIEDFASAYYELADAGAQVTLATPKGGIAPVDPASLSSGAQNPHVCRFLKDESLQWQLANTIRLETTGQFFYDAVFYPGGPGMLSDLVRDDTSVFLVANFYKHHKPMAFVGQGVAALLGVLDPWGGILLKGKHISASEQLKKQLKLSGAKLNESSAPVVQDDVIITGGHGMAADAAKMMIRMLTTADLTRPVEA